MKALVAAASAAVVVAAGAFALAPQAEIVTEIGIDAAPGEVWAVLADPAGYGDWNPFLVSMEGDIAEGATLTNRMKPAAGGEMTFRPTVLKVVPERELRWLGRLFLPRVFDGEHYFVLEERDGGTRLVHGERFRGVLLWSIDAEEFRADFEAMNEALKARVEARRREA
jgi:hypothetical protein